MGSVVDFAFGREGLEDEEEGCAEEDDDVEWEVIVAAFA